MVGIVKSVEGNTCSVQLGEVVITGVRLKVNVGNSTDSLMMVPEIGTVVLCGTLTGDLKELVALQFEKVKKIRWQQGGMILEGDSATGKFDFRNDSQSLTGLLEELKGIIAGLKVFTNSGPSGTPLPTTIIALNQFETHFKQLLK